jgi:hypothetical protein
MFTINLGGGVVGPKSILGISAHPTFRTQAGQILQSVGNSVHVLGQGRWQIREVGGAVTASQTTSPPPGGLGYRYTGLGSELLAHGIAFGGGWYLPLPPYPPPPARVIQ